MKPKVYYEGINTEDTRILILELSDKYIAFESPAGNEKPRYFNLYDKGEVEDFLSLEEYQFECPNCGKMMNYGTFEINTVHLLNEKTKDICQECWKKYTRDFVEGEYPNVLLEGKLLKDKIKKLLEEENPLKEIKRLVNKEDVI